MKAIAALLLAFFVGVVVGNILLRDNYQSIQSSISDFINILSTYSSLISAFAATLAAIIALYLGDWKSKLEKPKLKLKFSNNKSYPYFQKLSYEPYDFPIDIHGTIVPLSRPGFNARVMVFNKGKRTAKNVGARVEKIIITENNCESKKKIFYHPTTVKWSGEKDWKPVDIAPDSHFFLDLFWSINETNEEIVNHNIDKLESFRIEIEAEMLRETVVNDLRPSQRVYWNVWIDNSFVRGLLDNYDTQGEIEIYLIVNGENCSPIKFKAIIDWDYDSWNMPNIKIVNAKESLL